MNKLPAVFSPVRMTADKKIPGIFGGSFSPNAVTISVEFARIGCRTSVIEGERKPQTRRFVSLRSAAKYVAVTMVAYKLRGYREVVS